MHATRAESPLRDLSPNTIPKEITEGRKSPISACAYQAFMVFGMRNPQVATDLLRTQMKENNTASVREVSQKAGGDYTLLSMGKYAGTGDTQKSLRNSSLAHDNMFKMARVVFECSDSAFTKNPKADK